MHSLFDNSTSGMETLAQHGNQVIFSSLSEFYHPIRSQGFAIKYVVEGVEDYFLNGTRHAVGASQYLLTNCQLEGHVEIESKKNVRGICINLKPEILAEVAASLQRPDTAYADLCIGNYLQSAHFVESRYNATHTHLGQLLLNFSASIRYGKWNNDDLTTEFFYSLSEKIIADQTPVFKQLQQIPSLKPATKKDLYKRLLRGKEFIHSDFASPLTIERVAQEACLSQYHFFRLFKAVFGITPHQYILQKRLDCGSLLLQKQNHSVSDAAIAAGFPDIYTFSKAFKKRFGFSPSALLQ
ncbi:MAG: AraC family transcriptional regulator [Cytophagales bacterium]|nr:AraC family transcriptional regulator [Cytophagales bacterium]